MKPELGVVVVPRRLPRQGCKRRARGRALLGQARGRRSNGHKSFCSNDLLTASSGGARLLDSLALALPALQSSGVVSAMDRRHREARSEGAGVRFLPGAHLSITPSGSPSEAFDRDSGLQRGANHP